MHARPILLVDDYPLQTSFRMLVKKRTGREVVHATTFEDAVTRLNQPFTFCGLLLDIELSKEPGAPTGFDVLVAARRQEPRIPVAMLTGLFEPGLVARAAELGAFYVPKEANVMEALEHFFAAALAYDGDGTLDAAVDRVLVRLGIDPGLAAARVLRLHAHGLSPEEVRERLDISSNTYKGNCRELRQASGKHRVVDLVREIWRVFLGKAASGEG